MYTHARQFPHLAGMSDQEIRDLARRGMSRRPRLVTIMRLRNAIILLGMAIAAALLARYTSYQLGTIFILVGGVSTCVLLLWNVVWVNTVLYRVTRDEIERA